MNCLVLLLIASLLGVVYTGNITTFEEARRAPNCKCESNMCRCTRWKIKFNYTNPGYNDNSRPMGRWWTTPEPDDDYFYYITPPPPPQNSNNVVGLPLQAYRNNGGPNQPGGDAGGTGSGYAPPPPPPPPPPPLPQPNYQSNRQQNNGFPFSQFPPIFNPFAIFSQFPQLPDPFNGAGASAFAGTGGASAGASAGAGGGGGGGGGAGASAFAGNNPFGNIFGFFPFKKR